MTQASRPQKDIDTSFPAPSDSGPYTADEWTEYLQITYTGDEQATQGPLVSYLNELVVADNGTNAVTVGTGAGYVNGHLLISSEQETFAIPAGPAATRVDVAVMVENNSGVEVTQTIAGRPLLFPNDLSEYTATPAVPAHSARLAIIRGADGAGLPVVDKTTALYMVELARYTINNAPAITAQADLRQFVATPMGALHKVRETILGAPAASITVSNIPGNFTHLIIRASLKSTDNAAASATVGLQFNTIVGNEYGYFYRQAATVGPPMVVAAAAGGVGALLCGEVAASSAAQDADSFGTLEVIVHDYTSLRVKNVLTKSSFIDNTPDIRGAWGAGYWDRSLTANPQEAIYLFTLTPGAGNWDTASIVSVYGVT